MKAFRCDRCKEYSPYSPQITVKSHGIGSGTLNLELCYSCGMACTEAVEQALKKRGSAGCAAWERAEENGVGRGMVRHEGRCTYRIRNEDNYDYYFECDGKELHLDEEGVEDLMTLLQRLKD